MLERTQELLAINRMIASSLDYDQVLRLVVEKTTAFTNADSCVLLLAGTDKRARIAASFGIAEEQARDFSAPLDERINTVLCELLGYSQDDYFLGAPVIDQDSICGLLVVYRRSATASPSIDADDELFVSALADQAAIALRHASLYGEVARTNDYQSRLIETMQANTTTYLAYLDCDLRCIEINAAHCQAVGRTHRFLIGKTYDQIVKSKSLASTLEEICSRGTSAEMREVALENLNASAGTVYWDWGARPVIAENGSVAGIVITAIDVTERVHARRELEVESHRKDEFLAMLAHELRNPLSAIANSIGVIWLRMPKEEIFMRMREIANRQVQHMTRLLDDLLDVSRITRGKITIRRQAVELSDLIDQVMQWVRVEFSNRQQELMVTLPRRPLYLDGDRERLVQIITNLLTNAGKYTEYGGKIILTVKRAGELAEISVRDNGIGIDEETLPHVFDLFVQSQRQLDRKQGGLGIGLTIVKRLVELHDGSVEARSAGLGQGSEFIVRLPLTTEPHQAPDAERVDHQETLAELPASQRILVVEDNFDVAESLVTVLETAGHQVNVAYNGNNAIAMAIKEAPEAVLIDIGLPGMNGYEVAQRLRERLGASTPLIIALTGYGQSQDRQRGEDAGIYHYLVKPADPEQLIGLLHRELGRAAAPKPALN